MLILICGLPASGKSTVARRLSKELSSELIRTDIIRRDLIKNPEYTDKEKDLIYGAVFLIADYLLKNDLSVVIDGTFYKKSLRQWAKRLAEKRGKRFFLVETRAAEDTIIKRLERRKKNLKSPSDADIKVYYKIKEIFEEIGEDHIVVDTGWNIRQAIDEVVGQIKA